ncbi:hypothetical protein OUZ56_032513 [Daphnia magna]|uniref:4-alpha-glucanotransferase n=1 Tax=Daphnia magna TaxID=35525 RepID=A0ABR0B9J1_9CRUS|nr:hypothetical protein OUZ56_032513 [Daphnia magna]
MRKGSLASRSRSFPSEAGAAFLQVLPPHVLLGGETSPYGAVSAFALDPVYIALDRVPELGTRFPDGVGTSHSVNYAQVRALKGAALAEAAATFAALPPNDPRNQAFQHFLAAEDATWLDDYALYVVARDVYQVWRFTDFPAPLRDRDPGAIAAFRAEHTTAIDAAKYIQFLAFEQWAAARAELAQLPGGPVRLFGDLPFMVARDGADVWADPATFTMEGSLGVPPIPSPRRAGLAAPDLEHRDAPPQQLRVFPEANRPLAEALRRLPPRPRPRLFPPVALVFEAGRRERGDPPEGRARPPRRLHAGRRTVAKRPRPRAARRPPEARRRRGDPRGRSRNGSRFRPPGPRCPRPPRLQSPPVDPRKERHDHRPGRLPGERRRHLLDPRHGAPRRLLRGVRRGRQAPPRASHRPLPAERLGIGNHPKRRRFALFADSPARWVLALAQELLGVRDRINVPGARHRARADGGGRPRMNARRSGSYRAAEAIRPIEIGVYGAHFDEAANGTRFVGPVSERASHVEVALSDGVAGEERRVPMAPVRGSPWRHEVFVPGVGPGTAYGYRVAGPWNPSHGDRFNNAKLLIDPWARRLSRSPELPPGSAPAIFLHQHADGSPNSARAPHSLRAGHHPCSDNDAALKPCSLVATPWKTRVAALGPRPPRPAVPAHRTVVYEAHVKGLTMRHPAVPAALRGRYAALGHPAIIEHLQALGITTVELLPVHRMETEWWLKDRGFTNYWGYSPLGFLCVDDRFASDGGDPALELAGAVDALHRAGIEVLLDVVYNHTCEGGTLGPTFGFRGFGDALWYRKRGSEYTNESGCGNTLDATSPIVQALVVDSLRFLYEEIGVDGFRFDLAPILGRGHDGRFDPRARLMAAIAEDPVLAGAKLISEPWDLAGALAGAFPPPWHDWNDHFRDDLRRFFRGEAIVRSRFATRIGGSSDLFRTRGPLASVNFVTAHDGFTLRDLVSYDRKHNQANGEENRDGSDDNRSWNGGAEGETDAPAIRENRLRRAKSLFLTLALAKGIPDDRRRRRTLADPRRQQQPLLPGRSLGLRRLGRLGNSPRIPTVRERLPRLSPRVLRRRRQRRSLLHRARHPLAPRRRPPDFERRLGIAGRRHPRLRRHRPRKRADLRRLQRQHATRSAFVPFVAASEFPRSPRAAHRRRLRRDPRRRRRCVHGTRRVAARPPGTAAGGEETASTYAAAWANRNRNAAFQEGSGVSRGGETVTGSGRSLSAPACSASGGRS